MEQLNLFLCCLYLIRLWKVIEIKWSIQKTVKFLLTFYLLTHTHTIWLCYGLLCWECDMNVNHSIGLLLFSSRLIQVELNCFLFLFNDTNMKSLLRF